MKLYLSTTSPYSRLALIAALHSGKRDLQLHYVLPCGVSEAFLPE